MFSINKPVVFYLVVIVGVCLCFPGVLIRSSLYGMISDSALVFPCAISRYTQQDGSMPFSSGQDGNMPFSSGQDSFSKFTMDLVRQYMKEEEVRAQHQSSLLRLRQKALREKTKAELAWLEHQKRQDKHSL